MFDHVYNNIGSILEEGTVPDPISGEKNHISLFSSATYCQRKAIDQEQHRAVTAVSFAG